MTREERKAKLLAIKICVVNITYTYDVGLFFNVITKDGVHFEEGYNLSMWPCIKLSINNEVRDLQKRIIDGEQFSKEQLMSYSFCKELCTFRGYNESFVFSEEILKCALEAILQQLPKLDCSGDYAYAFVDPEQTRVEITLFSTYEKLQDYCLEKWSDRIWSWDDMNNEELEEWYKLAEYEDWESLPYVDVSRE